MGFLCVGYGHAQRRAWIDCMERHPLESLLEEMQRREKEPGIPKEGASRKLRGDRISVEETRRLIEDDSKRRELRASR